MPNLLFKCWIEPIHLEIDRRRLKYIYIWPSQFTIWVSGAGPGRDRHRFSSLPQWTVFFYHRRQSGAKGRPDQYSPQPPRHYDGHTVTHSLRLCHVMGSQEGAPLCVRKGGPDRLPRVRSGEAADIKRILKVSWNLLKMFLLAHM